VHGQESNSQPVDRKSDALTITLPSHLHWCIWQDADKEAQLLAEIAQLKTSLKEKDSEIEKLRSRLAKYEHSAN